MCGICGIASGRGVVDRERLGRMAATLVHRGPDSEGMHVEGPVGIAARRLAIIDLTGGDQPIANEDGSVVVVQNGEIYNYRELAHTLARAGHTFHTRSDTEVLVHGYEEWGAGVWERLRGMFAVAVWDARRGRLTLARDRFGIKPLYYRDRGGELSFASELDALPHGEVDLNALEAFLSFNVVPAPLSIFSDIRKLLPGHTLTWESGTTTYDRFARPGPLPARHDEDEAELVEECRARLRDSVRAHLIADVPVGVLLSGGVDSGALAALAAEESSEAVRTFSIGFEEASFDELAGARAVSARYGTRHRELVLRPDAALLLPALAQAFDEPFADSSALPTYLVSQARCRGREGRALGRGRRRALRRLLHLRRRSARRACRPARLAGTPAGRTAADLDAARQLRVQGETVRAVGAPATAGTPSRLEGDLLRRRPRRADRQREQLRSARDAPRPVRRDGGHELLTRLQDVDLGLYLVDDLLTKTDRASMAWSLEARVPFMDTVVANFAFSLPVRHKVRGLSKKRLLRQAVLPLLPREVVHGRKRGFSIPAAAWLRGELEPFAREILSPETIRRQGFLQPSAVTRVLDDHVAGRADLSRQLWGLLAFTLWHEHHVEGVRRDAPLASVVA